MEYKPEYTKEEIDEMVNWFTSHTFEKEMDMGHGVYICDVEQAIAPLMHMAKTQYENRNYSGAIHFLSLIRDECIRDRIGETKQSDRREVMCFPPVFLRLLMRFFLCLMT